MLLRVTIQNMLSFYNKTTFDMFPNPKREGFINHINTDEKIPLLKHALIYGANGSGKSLLIGFEITTPFSRTFAGYVSLASFV